ncbi:DUF1202 family protein, partial [Escherichia coli]
MKKQWIVGTALLMLMTGNAWADGEPPTENILKDQFKKQYHGILKLDAITLKNLDAKEGANKQVISSQADSLIKISRIWADFFPANTSNQPI